MILCLLTEFNQFLDVYNLFCNIYGKNDIKNINLTNEIIIDDVCELLPLIEAGASWEVSTSVS